MGLAGCVWMLGGKGGAGSNSVSPTEGRLGSVEFGPLVVSLSERGPTTPVYMRFVTRIRSRAITLRGRHAPATREPDRARGQRRSALPGDPDGVLPCRPSGDDERFAGRHHRVTRDVLGAYFRPGQVLAVLADDRRDPLGLVARDRHDDAHEVGAGR